MIIQGAADAKVATLAPSPRVTKVIGIAQQSRVPEVVNSSSQLSARFTYIWRLFIHLKHHPNTNAQVVTIPLSVVIIGLKFILSPDNNITLEIDQHWAGEQMLAGV